jgi:hypothetical protein
VYQYRFNITHTTTGATGISNNTAGSNGLPAGIKLQFVCKYNYY